MSRRHAIPYKHFDPRLYFGDQGMVTQSFVEANIKRGTQWFIEQEVTFSGTKRYLFRTGQDPVIIKYYIVDSDERVAITLDEATVGTDGTDVTTDLLKNYNRINQANNYCKIFDSPTGVTLGERIFLRTTPETSNQNPTPANPTNALGIEYILKPNTDHVITYTASQNNFRLWDHLSFYQGVLSDDIL